MKKGLIILFPGVRYSVDSPLLYYAGLQYEVRGYDKIKIEDYHVEKLDGLSHLEAYAEQAKTNVKEQLEQVDFSGYEEIVFASKSIGTVIALRLEDELKLSRVTHIVLTPITETIPYLMKNRRVKCMVTGSKDKMVDLETLQEVCRVNELPLTVIEDVGHRLETKESIQKNIEIVAQVVVEY